MSQSDPQPSTPPAAARGRGRPLLVAAACALGAAGAVFALLAAGDDAGVELVTPPTLAGGAYRLEKDTEALRREGTSVQAGMPKGTTSVLARYRHAHDASATLAFSGAYGALGSPEAVERDMYRAYETGAGASIARERREFRPHGPAGPSVTCEVVRLSAHRPLYVPVCTWAERADAAMVLELNPRHTTPQAVNVPAFATLAATLHQETRLPR
ncbi:hypothetical protein [Streptomyces sp. URMC 123]|uniref:hypothetical protein n=1 Tax=Streptomyces sp. URMC 123 TaxID=3423403 RepID=UPI003F1BA5DB